jgi:hypothetical protein
MESIVENSTIARSPEANELATDGAADAAFWVVQKADPAACVDQPFPYIVIDQCLPEPSYRALFDSFPLDLVPDSVRAVSNKRYDIFASWGKSENDPACAPAPWRTFMQQNAAARTARAACALLGPRISGTDGNFFQPLVGADAIDPADISVRVSVGVNTPALETTRVRGAHCDSRTKAFVGLYYLKDPAEGDAGGDLLIYRWKPGRKRERAWPFAIDDDEVEVVASITYAPNRLLLFMNSDDAIHGVSPRFPSEYFRRLIVISGWFPKFRDDPATVRSLGLSATV